MRGFTLLEVLISLAILAGAALTVIGTVNHHLALAAGEHAETVAVILARSKLEDPAFAASPDNEGSFAPDWPDYRWRKELLPTGLPAVKKLVLTVSWQGARRTLPLEQYIVSPQH